VPLFYRFTHSQNPTVDDFKSHAELSPKGRPKLVSERDWAGVTVQRTLESARAFYDRQTAERKDKLGHFITAVDLPGHLEVKQEGSDPNHYEVWAPAEELLGYSTVTEPAVPLAAGDNE
jgi:hypothetical protein